MDNNNLRVFFQGKRVLFSKTGRNICLTYENGDPFDHPKQGVRFTICCSVCEASNEISFAAIAYHIKKTHKYLCRPCGTKGDLNPFYGKKHSPEMIQKLLNNRRSFEGTQNPFYGKTHSKETIEKIKKNSPDMSGEKNPFYGKKHSPETLAKIKESNAKRILLRSNEIALQNLEKAGLSIEKLHQAFSDLNKPENTFATVAEKYQVDKRTLQRYLLLFVCSKDRLRQIAIDKQYRRAISSQELKLKKHLEDAFGTEAVEQQKKIGPYFYDFLVKDILLVEYDGYYWHQIRKSANDENKTALAKICGLELYRVLEPKSRKTDFLTEIKKIKEFIHEIQNR